MSEPRKHVLILGGRDTSVEMLEGLPIDITLFQTADRLTPLQQRLAKRVVVTALSDEAEVRRLARAIHSVNPFDAAASFLEVYLLTTARICEELGIAGNPVQPVLLTLDKLQMREALAGTAIPAVPFRRCLNADDVRRALAELGSPMVLKPSTGNASEGVVLLRTPDEVADAVAWASRPTRDPLIAEAYIEGDEYSVEAISHRGAHRILAVTEKQTTGVPHFIETGHQLPARLSLGVTERIHAVVIQLLDCIGHREGPSHTEIRLREGIPYIIESHTRYGGDRIWEMVYLTQGVHMAQATVCQLVGLPMPVHQPPFAAAAVRFLIAPPKSCIAVEGLEQAAAAPGVYRVEAEVKPGDVIRPLASSDDRCGYVLGGGATVPEAVTRVESAAAQIRIT